LGASFALTVGFYNQRGTADRWPMEARAKGLGLGSIGPHHRVPDSRWIPLATGFVQGGSGRLYGRRPGAAAPINYAPNLMEHSS